MLYYKYNITFILQATVVAAIARTAGATATAMAAPMHAVDTVVTSNQEEATIDRPLTTREDTTRYLT